MKKHTYGFTIVELLIVIVVIAILAAISVVAYTGIQDRARTTKLRADFQTIQQALALHKAQHGKWPICSTGDDVQSECALSQITPQLEVTGLPTMTGASNTTPILYVVGNNAERWAVRLVATGGNYCKQGENMAAAWWGSVAACW